MHFYGRPSVQTKRTIVQFEGCTKDITVVIHVQAAH